MSKTLLSKLSAHSKTIILTSLHPMSDLTTLYLVYIIDWAPSGTSFQFFSKTVLDCDFYLLFHSLALSWRPQKQNWGAETRLIIVMFSLTERYGRGDDYACMSTSWSAVIRNTG